MILITTENIHYHLAFRTQNPIKLKDFQRDIVALFVIVLEQTTLEISDIRLTIPSIYSSWFLHDGYLPHMNNFIFVISLED